MPSYNWFSLKNLPPGTYRPFPNRDHWRGHSQPAPYRFCSRNRSHNYHSRDRDRHTHQRDSRSSPQRKRDNSLAVFSCVEYLDYLHKSSSSNQDSYWIPLDRSSYSDTLCQWGRSYKDAQSMARILRHCRVSPHRRDSPDPRT